MPTRSSKSTYAFHLAKHMLNVGNDTLGLKPKFVQADHEEAPWIDEDFRDLGCP